MKIANEGQKWERSTAQESDSEDDEKEGEKEKRGPEISSLYMEPQDTNTKSQKEKKSKRAETQKHGEKESGRRGSEAQTNYSTLDESSPADRSRGAEIEGEVCSGGTAYCNFDDGETLTDDEDEEEEDPPAVVNYFSADVGEGQISSDYDTDYTAYGDS